MLLIFIYVYFWQNLKISLLIKFIILHIMLFFKDILQYEILNHIKPKHYE